jgi:hypothetical protein
VTIINATLIDANFGVIWATVDRLLDGFLAMLPLLAAAIFVFVLLLFAARGFRHVTEKALQRSSNQSAATAIGRLLYVTMVGLAVMIAFPSMTPGRLISVLGIGGVAIGFAFKDIFQNLLAGILILLRHPFRVGDEITTGEFTGTVESIETRATFIRTYDGRRVIIPNGDVYTKPVTVISAYDMLRSEYDVASAMGTSGAGQGHRARRDQGGRWGARRSGSGCARLGIGRILQEHPDPLVDQACPGRCAAHPRRCAKGSGRGDCGRGDGLALSDAGRAVSRPDRGDRTRQREGWPAGKTPPKPRYRAPPRAGDIQKPST